MVPRKPDSNTSVTGDAGWRMVSDSSWRPAMVSITGGGAAVADKAAMQQQRIRARNSVDMGVLIVELKTPASQPGRPVSSGMRRIDGSADEWQTGAYIALNRWTK